jgi:hypothetical protein
MPSPAIIIETQLRTCDTKIKIALPSEIKRILPYPLVAKGYKTKNNIYFISMQMYKSQYDNPIKRYHWKKDTDVMDALQTLTEQFIEEYRLPNIAYEI